MSGYVAGAVWNSGPRKRGQRYVLAAIADNANDTGFAYPEVRLIAAKCLMTPRHVLRVLAGLEAEGWIEIQHNSNPRNYKANAYQIRLEKLKFERPRPAVSGDTRSREKASGEKASGDKKSRDGASGDIRSREARGSGDIVSRGQVTSETVSGDIRDNPPAPPIRRNRQEPSIDLPPTPLPGGARPEPMAKPSRLDPGDLAAVRNAWVGVIGELKRGLVEHGAPPGGRLPEGWSEWERTGFESTHVLDRELAEGSGDQLRLVIGAEDPAAVKAGLYKFQRRVSLAMLHHFGREVQLRLEAA